MFNALSDWLFDSSGLTPHGFCLLWQPGLDLDLRTVRRRHRPRLFFHTARPRRDRPPEAGPRVPAAAPAVRRLHPAVRRDPLARCLDALVADLRRSGGGQGDDGAGVDLHRRRALEADACRTRASFALAVPRGQRGAAGDGGEALPGAEDGGRRPADRRHRARLQQHDPGRGRRPDADRAPDRERPARGYRSLRRTDAARAEQRGRPDEPPVGVLSQAGSAAEAHRARPLHCRHEGILAAHPRPGDSAEARARRREVRRRLRRPPARGRAAQSRHQRARRDAGRRAADDLGVGPQAECGGPRRPGPGQSGRLCRNQSLGHRRRHDAGRPQPGLRAVLHHQADRQRNRPRPVAGLWLRPPVRRILPHREQTRRGDLGFHLLCRAGREPRARFRPPPGSPARPRRPRAAQCSSSKTRTRCGRRSSRS